MRETLLHVEITTLQKILRAKVTQYEHKHNEMILPHALAQEGRYCGRESATREAKRRG